jgi:hypothetical protein
MAKLQACCKENATLFWNQLAIGVDHIWQAVRNIDRKQMVQGK